MRGSKINASTSPAVTNGKDKQKNVVKGPIVDNDNDDIQKVARNVVSVRSSNSESSSEIEDANENSIQYLPEKGELESAEEGSTLKKDSENKGILL